MSRMPGWLLIVAVMLSWLLGRGGNHFGSAHHRAGHDVYPTVDDRRDRHHLVHHHHDHRVLRRSSSR